MKKLFKSKTSYDIIALLIDGEQSKFYLNEIARLTSKDPANVSRELDNLIEEGIVLVKKKGEKKYYFLNNNCSYLGDLISIFKKQKKIEIEARFKKDWILGEEIMNANPWFMTIPFYGFTNQFKEPSGRAYSDLACMYKGYYLKFYIGKQDSFEVADNLVKKFVKNPSFMEEVNEKIRFFGKELREVVGLIPESNLESLSSKKIWDLYKKHEDLHFEYYKWGWIPPAVDMFHDNLTNKGKELLGELGVPSDKIEDYLQLLTQPENESLIKQEDDNLMKIGIKVQEDKEQYKIFKDLFEKFKEEDVKYFGLYTHTPAYEEKFEEVVKSLINKIRADILNDVQDHYAKYFFTKFIYTEEQGVYSFEHYLKSLVRLVSGDSDLKETHKKKEKELLDIKIKKKDLIKRIKLPKDLIIFFNAWGDFMVTKIDRRYAQLFAFYKTTFLLEEIAKRLGISLKELRFMTSKEIYQSLFNNILDKEDIKKRVEFALYYTAKDTEVYYSGAEAKKIFEEYIEKDDDKDVVELQGQCGCRGQARGLVKIVNVISDMPKVNKGDILVSISTQPDLLPAMKRAAAFITDQGGVTSHAAIVARETNTPCVIATRNATKVLKDGDEVEVYADKGLVKVIKRA
jgi:phosphohistidine swiveling domain-containing protein/DNA-binding transcriptional ArsR family regulator